MRARCPCRKTSRGGRAGAALPLITQSRRRRLDFAAFVEDFDSPLGILEPRMAEPRQLHAAFVERERLFEREVALLELLHNRFELRDGRLEIFDRWLRHLVSPVSRGPCRAPSAPRTPAGRGLTSRERYRRSRPPRHPAGSVSCPHSRRRRNPGRAPPAD